MNTDPTRTDGAAQPQQPFPTDVPREEVYEARATAAYDAAALVSAEAREAAPVALTISIDEDFGNGAFWSWFTSVWPEPKRTRHQHSNWVYRRDMAHAGWCAAAKEEIALRLQIAELKKKAPDPSAAAPVSVEAREAATRLFREYISQEECAEIIQRAIDRATEKLLELTRTQWKHAEKMYTEDIDQLRAENEALKANSVLDKELTNQFETLLPKLPPPHPEDATGGWLRRLELLVKENEALRKDREKTP